MEHELDDDFFHGATDGYNYSTVPGERINCSKLFIFEGRGYIRDYISIGGDRLYLKCRKCQQKPMKCLGRAIIVGELVMLIVNYINFCEGSFRLID